MVCAGLLVIGCRSSDDGTLEGEVPDPSTTTTATSTSIATTTTEPACDKIFELTGEPALTADLDGDGEEDRIRLAAPEGQDPEAAGTYVLQVALAAGGGATIDIEADQDASVGVIGAAVLDAGANEREVLWVRVGAGAATTIVGLYHLDGCTLEAATFENGEPVQLPVGGTVGTASGAACGSVLDPEADLLVHEATLITGREYEVVTTEYRWEDGVLVRSPAGAPTVARSEDVTEASGFRCGDLRL